MIALKQVSILLVEDHQVVRQAIGRFLREKGHMEKLEFAGTAAQALQMIPNLDVDMVLVDVSLPDMNGINLVTAILNLRPELPCLMLSGHLAANYVQRSLNAGARGYVLKGNADALLEGIEKVSNGEIYLSEEVRNLV